MRRLTVLLASVVSSASLLAGCHPGPVLATGPKPVVGGTIAGIVSTDANAPVAGRKVTAVETTTSQRFDATTGTNGGFTIKVPIGTYRLELELQAGETIVKQPSETHVSNSDLDPHRDFVITIRRSGG
jgi:Carboxypeptidase regulatory-like domain